MVLSPLLLRGLATIMGSLEGLQEAREDTLRVETPVGDIPTRIVEVKVVQVVTVVGHILHRAVVRPMVLVACLVVHPVVEGEVGTELVRRTINKTVPLVVQLRVVGRT